MVFRENRTGRIRIIRETVCRVIMGYVRDFPQRGKSFTFACTSDILISVKQSLFQGKKVEGSDRMAEKEPGSQSDFMIEKIKERPISRTKLIRRTLITVSMAVIFGLVASFTFLALEPVLNNLMSPKEEIPQIYFPEETEEMLPEEMLSESILTDIPMDVPEDPDAVEGVVLEEEQIQEILSGVRLNLTNYRQLYAALADYSQILQKAMVTITSISSRVDWFNGVDESTRRSSGVIIANNTKDLLILTDFTPLEKAEKLNITFCNGAEILAELVRVDTTTNLAVLAVPLESLPQDFMDSIAIANQGSSNYKNLAGTPVIALGTPMGTSNSVGYGVITSTSGLASEVDVNYKLLQTDIVGSSTADGVLFNLQGQLVGIITSHHNSSDLKNLITAYGITDLKKRMEKLSNNQPFVYAGIFGESVSLGAHEALGVPYGAYVREVILDSPAMRAGIRQGDVIVMMDEKEVTSYNDYMTIMALQKPEMKVSVRVMRQAQNEYKEMNLEIVLGELK